MMLKLSTNTKIIFKNNLGVKGSEIELFWGGFTAINLNSILKIEGFFSSILVDLFSIY